MLNIVFMLLTVVSATNLVQTFCALCDVRN
jgi:hypothetical protein